MRVATALISLVTATCLAASLMLVSRAIVRDRFGELERTEAQLNVDRAVNAINDQAAHLGNTTADWATWDETYDFAVSGNPGYAPNNLSTAALQNLNADLFVVLGREGEVRLVRSSGMSDESQAALTEDIRAQLSLPEAAELEGYAVSAVIPSRHGPLIFAARPILTSQAVGPAQGVLVLARLLDTGNLSNLSSQIVLPLTIVALDEAGVGPFGGPLKLHQAFASQAISSDQLAALGAIVPRTGDPVLAVRIEMPRDEMNQAAIALRSISAAAILAAAVFSVVIFVTLEIFVVRRLKRLGKSLQAIGGGGDLSARVAVQGRDEVGQLATNVNEMLAGFEESEKNYRGLVSSQRELERKIEATQRLEGLAVLSGGIAHDFNNLLMAILGNAGLARLSVAGDSAAVEALAEIETAAERAADLTRHLMAYAGGGKLVVEEIELAALARDTAQLMRRVIRPGAELDIDLPERLPAIEGDATQLRQIVMNLIANASDSLPDDSGDSGRPRRIGVRAGVMQCDARYLAKALSAEGAAPGEYTFIEVRDTGSGISPEVRARMFEPFYSTKGPGRGLGLAAAIGIVKSHRGAFALESAAGHGTTIRVLFPTIGSAALAA